MIRRSTGKSRKRARVRITDEFSEIKKKLYSDAASILEEGFSDIVKDTPVETGYAASNWKVSREGASESSAPPKIQGDSYRSKDEVIADGKSVIKLLKKYGFESNLKFFNATPYINVLENSSSSPTAFFIKRSTVKMRNKFSKLKG
tara:strand:+ start:541 stop:978 length:438 start_codon:yes stop_codon:yes gene_type:complete